MISEDMKIKETQNENKKNQKMKILTLIRLIWSIEI